MEIKVPVLGESVTEVTVANWLKKEGDAVKLNEPLCELESEKATLEVVAEADGILHITAKAGDVLPIGAVICSIDSSGAQSTPEVAAAPTTLSAPSVNTNKASVIDIKVPVVGESISEVTINVWHKASGSVVALDEKICDLDTDKATFEVTAPAAGILEVVAEAGSTLEIGGLLARVRLGGAVEAAPVTSAPVIETNTSQSSGNHLQNYASPAASKILSEKNIQASEVQGSGKDGRITKADALSAQKTSTPIPPAATPSTTAPVSSSEENESRGTKREKMTTLRKTIAKKLVAAKNETAMLTTFNEVDMSGIMEMRKKYKDKFKEKHEVGLGFMSFFTKAVSIALQEVPAINAMVTGEEIVYHNYCDISVAVSTPRGLVVPVIRNAESLSFAQIEKEIIRLATRARDGKLSIPEMTGGTFTITNGGIFGSMLSTPILNIPQSAILGMHNIVERPVAINGQVVIRPIMYVALSYDHRIIDGKESVTFLYRVKEMLEDPTRLLLDV
ncbi:MAG: 2-oxoglutarate dehydrogenase complex dihydrolipoyllysine-residue succinyltransferase [Cytophagales bacterium]|nr:MAG: 2-oxoglutarate dehydrogenase complex dihydrolipoyllysine-residue succinyltransferase [Cytophagales bacterium]